MILIKSKLARLSNESLAILALRIIDTVYKSEIATAKATKQFVALKEVNERFQQAVEPYSNKQTSEAIDAKFNERRNLFVALYVYIQGMLNSPDPETRVAAGQLFDVINKYGKNFSNLKIADQSLRYIRIIESLKSAVYTTALSKTLLTDKLAQLDTLQLDYEDLYMNRSNTRKRISASTMRTELTTAIRLHYEESYWMADQSGLDEWFSLCHNIDMRFGEVNVSAAKQAQPTESTFNTLSA